MSHQHPDEQSLNSNLATAEPELVNAESGLSSDPTDAPRLWVGLLPLAFLFRLTNFSGVFTPAGIFPQATDSYYHMRRILATLNQFPHVPDADTYVSFPVRGQIFWPYGFDLINAALVKILTLGNPTQDQALMICSLLPPLIGSITAILTYFIGLELGSWSLGLWAGLLVAILPAVTSSGGVGYVDHHVFESFWMAAFLLCLIRAVNSPHESPRAWRSAFLAGAMMTGGLICTTTFPAVLCLYAAVTGCQLVFCWRDQTQRQQTTVINARLWTGMVVSLFPFIITTYFEPAGVNPILTISWFLGLALALPLLVLLWGVSRNPQTSALQTSGIRLAVVCLVLGGLVVSQVDIMALGNYLRQALRFASTSDPMVSTIQESTPLFRLQGRLVFWTYSGFLVFWPVALVWRIWSSWRTSLAWWSLALLSLPLTGMAFLQWRFSDLFGVPFALITAFLIEHGVSRISAWIADKMTVPWLSRPQLVLSLTVLISTGLLWPTLSLFTFSRPFVAIEGPMFLNLFTTFEWIKTHTPPTSETGQRPEDYGVVCDWNLGHWIVFYAQRPVIASPFSVTVWHRLGVRDGAAIFTSPPAKAIQLMEQRRARYILITPLNAYEMLRNSQWDPEANVNLPLTDETAALRVSLYAELLGRDGIPNGRPESVDLRHFRLVYETAELTHPSLHRPFGLLFERVPGAIIRGHCLPNAVIHLSLPLQTNGNRQFVYQDQIQASPGGTFECQVPYANGQQRFSEVQSTAPYTLESQGQKIELTVTETEVLTGAVKEISFASVKN